MVYGVDPVANVIELITASMDRVVMIVIEGNTEMDPNAPIIAERDAAWRRLVAHVPDIRVACSSSVAKSTPNCGPRVRSRGSRASTNRTMLDVRTTLRLQTIYDCAPASGEGPLMSTRTITVGADSTSGALAARVTEALGRKVAFVEAGLSLNDADVANDLRNVCVRSAGSRDGDPRADCVEPTSAREPQPYPRGRVVGEGGNAAVLAWRAPRDCVLTNLRSGAAGERMAEAFCGAQR